MGLHCCPCMDWTWCHTLLFPATTENDIGVERNAQATIDISGSSRGVSRVHGSSAILPISTVTSFYSTFSR